MANKPLVKKPIPGYRIFQARVAIGLSQEKLGVLIGLDEGTASTRISRYENGIHEPPISTAKNIAKALKVPLNYLYSDQDEIAELILHISKLSKNEIIEITQRLIQ